MKNLKVGDIVYRQAFCAQVARVVAVDEERDLAVVHVTDLGYLTAGLNELHDTEDEASLGYKNLELYNETRVRDDLRDRLLVLKHELKDSNEEVRFLAKEAKVLREKIKKAQGAK